MSPLEPLSSIRPLSGQSSINMSNQGQTALDKYRDTQCPMCHIVYATDASDPRAPCHGFECGHVVCVTCYKAFAVTTTSMRNSNPIPKIECPTCNFLSEKKTHPPISYTLMGLIADLRNEQELQQERARNEEAFNLKCQACAEDVHIDRIWICTRCEKADSVENKFKLCSFCGIKKHSGHELKWFLPFKNKSTATEAEAEFQAVLKGYHDLIMTNYQDNKEGFDEAVKAVRLVCERSRDANTSQANLAIIQNAREKMKEFDMASEDYIQPLRLYSAKIKGFVDDMNKIAIETTEKQDAPPSTTFDFLKTDFLKTDKRNEFDKVKDEIKN